MPRTFTVQLSVQLNPHASIGPQELDSMPAEQLASYLSFWTGTKPAYDGCTIVGTATTEVTLMGRDEVVLNKVEALRAEKARTQAEAQAAVTRLESQIQQLLAITHEVA